MRPVSPPGLLAAVLMGAVAGGCHQAEMSVEVPGSSGSRADGPTVPCPPFTEIRAQLVSGNVTFKLDDGPAQLRPLSPGDPPVGPTQGSGRCGVDSFGTYVYPDSVPASQPGDWVLAGGTFGVACDLGELKLEANYWLFDPRAWAVGVYRDPPEGGRVVLVKAFDGGSCAGSVAGAIRVAVTQALGGPAPYPAGVTPDYVREFEVHLESMGPTSADGSCQRATFGADLHFLQTAAGAMNNPHPQCHPL